MRADKRWWSIEGTDEMTVDMDMTRVFVKYCVYRDGGGVIDRTGQGRRSSRHSRFQSDPRVSSWIHRG